MTGKVTIFKCGKNEEVLKINVESAFSPDAEQCVQYPDHGYPNSDRNHCLPKIVTFLAFEDALGMSLAGIDLCFCVVTAVVLWVFVKHRDTP